MPSPTTAPPSTTTTTSTNPPSIPPLESDLLSHLTSSPALEDLHATLLCALQRTGWTERIRKLAQELLRHGQCERFDDVVEAVVASAEGRHHLSLSSSFGSDNYGNGNGNGHGHGHANGTTGSGEDIEDIDVRIPSAVVEQGVRAIKEVLREVVVREDDSDLLDGVDSGHQDQHGNGNGNGGAASGSGSGTPTPAKQSPAKGKAEALKNGENSPVKKTEKKKAVGKTGK